jgi:GlpG protein
VVTWSLIGASVLAALVSGFQFWSAALDPLRISLGTSMAALKEVREGQVWRLITPIFIHSGPLHLLFNMLWLKDLGGIIEHREGSWKLLSMVAVIAALSNFGQYQWAGPHFGGMSGVVFGLFGYIWIRGRLDPRSGYWMDPNTVGLMIAWFFICAFGIISQVANMAHGVGLAAGMGWGWISSMWSQRN